MEVLAMSARKWTSEEKMAIVLEGIRGLKSVAEICREHKISQGQYYKWRDKFLEGGKKGLSSNVSNNNSSEIERLQKIIGKQAIQIDILKKTEEILGSR